MTGVFTPYVRVCCYDASGNVLAEGRARNVPNARRLARWLLENVSEARSAAVPRLQYEVEW